MNAISQRSAAMKSKAVAYAALSLGLLSAVPAPAETWTLDKAHTEVRFTWDHLGLSRQGGRFLDVSGTVVFDPESPAASRVEVTIPLASLSTGVAKLDELLKATKDFFDVETHPLITFKSTAITMKSDRTLDVTGELTLNGVTHPVTLDVVWNFTGDHPLANINPVYAGFYSSGFSATTQLRRSDWGIRRTIPYVSDEIRISIETEMHRDTPSSPEAPPKSTDTPAGEAADGASSDPSSGEAATVSPPASAPPGGLGDEAVDQTP
ncbi:MAG: YceI family protein [Hyphomicrobium sp.]